MARSFFVPRLIFGALFAFIALCPASMAENVQGSMEETVYLTETARQILGDDLDESLYGAEEGILDMRYVVLTGDGEPLVAGVRLRYPATVELSALSIDTYEVADSSYCGLFVNDDGVWGHAETAGKFVFLMFRDMIPLRELKAAYEAREAEMMAQWGVAPGCGMEIVIWQTKTIWLSNGNYVPGHMFFATDGLYPDEERVMQKNSMRKSHGDGRGQRRIRGYRHQDVRRDVERIRGP